MARDIGVIFIVIVFPLVGNRDPSDSRPISLYHVAVGTSKSNVVRSASTVSPKPPRVAVLEDGLGEWLTFFLFLLLENERLTWWQTLFLLG